MPRDLIYSSTSGFTGWTARTYDDFTWSAKSAPSSFTWTADSILRIADYYVDRGVLANDGILTPE